MKKLSKLPLFFALFVSGFAWNAEALDFVEAESLTEVTAREGFKWHSLVIDGVYHPAVGATEEVADQLRSLASQPNSNDLSDRCLFKVSFAVVGFSSSIAHVYEIKCTDSLSSGR